MKPNGMSEKDTRMETRILLVDDEPNVLQGLCRTFRRLHHEWNMAGAGNEPASIEMGAEDYLLKPFNPVLLKARVSACVEKKRLHASRIESSCHAGEVCISESTYREVQADVAATKLESLLVKSRVQPVRIYTV